MIRRGEVVTVALVVSLNMGNKPGEVEWVKGK